MKCPTCRRTADEDDVECKRCGTELRVLVEMSKTVRSVINRGYFDLYATQPKKAEKHFKKALEIAADSKDAIRGLALAAFMQGNFADATRWHAHYQYYFRGAKPELTTEVDRTDYAG